MLRLQVLDLARSILPSLVQKYGQEIPENCVLEVSKPKNPAHGDFSIDFAFKVAKSFGRSPMVIADEIAYHMDYKARKFEDFFKFIHSIEVAAPGFVNVTVSEVAWLEMLPRIKMNDFEFGRSTTGEDVRVLLEYVSANPTGPLTIAHGRQACLGDSLANIMEAAGYTVHREYYLNDGGRQILLLGKSTRARYLEKLDVPIVFPEEGYQGEYIKDIAVAILEEVGDQYKDMPEADSLPFFSQFASDYIMKTIREDLQMISVDFDTYYSEQSLHGEKIDEVLQLLSEGGYSYEKDGALWFETTKFADDKDRVLRKSDGSYTYLVPDIAYHRDKFRRGYSQIVDFLGPDHHGYINRLKAAVTALGYNADALKVLIVQLTTLYKNGEPFRMSTRAGNFISLRELIDEVGPDAARFFFLMRKVDSQLDFDLELAKEKSQENPVFYLQYAHARIASLIRKADCVIDEDVELFSLREPEEFALIKILHDFPDQISQTASSMEPYRLADYLKTVAAQFHQYYNMHRVVTDDAELTKARLLLCDCVRIVLRNGLTILGVSHPDTM